jgi:tRNA(fMet)-specific endonuclease VapC
MYLLDTNSCISILNDSSVSTTRRLRQHLPSEIYLCSVVKAELLYGARRSSREADNLRLLHRFFAPFVSLPFDDNCAGQYGSIRADLSQLGALIGPNDLMIAATALANGMTLVTHKLREFSRVPGLLIEDWEGP